MTAKIKVIKRSDIARCPSQRLDPEHYRDDGTCRCSVGASLDRAQSDALDDLAYAKEKHAGRLHNVAAERYTQVQGGFPIDRTDLIDFVIDFHAMPFVVESLVRYAALRDAFGEEGS